VVVEQLETILDAGSAVRNLGEVVLAEDLLVGETERTVVSQPPGMVVLQSFPQLRRVMLLAAAA
jgi:hypothetical protein